MADTNKAQNDLSNLSENDWMKAVYQGSLMAQRSVYQTLVQKSQDASKAKMPQ